jgi:hypothetical protein
MPQMKALIAGLALLISGISTAQLLHRDGKDTKAQCRTILKIESILYAETKDETIDRQSVMMGKRRRFTRSRRPRIAVDASLCTKWPSLNITPNMAVGWGDGDGSSNEPSLG